MKKNKLLAGLLAAAMCASMITGCGDTNKEPAQQTDESNQTGTIENGDSNNSDDTDAQTGLAFSELSNLEFYYSSGAGGWATMLRINDDGSFEGHYYDSDMGDTGDGYPDGTCYESDFTGTFAQPEKVNDYTYSMKIESMKADREAGTEEIKDNIRYCYTEPFGFEDAEELLVYLPGSNTSDLPQSFVDWVSNADMIENDKLNSYGLYNEKGECGFSSYESAAADETDTQNESEAETGTESGDSDIDTELADIQSKEDELMNKLQTEDLTQSEMNEVSSQAYQLWDDELNSIWSRLKEKLDSDAYATLLDEQRVWIANKEDEMKAAGAEYEGGTMQPLMESDKGRELTRERVYELADLLKN